MTDPARTCWWCRAELERRVRRDARFCSQRCRQAAHRFGSECVARRRATSPLRLAYADPPYPGKAHYYRNHPDYAGEVDHAALLSHLQQYDGWALSTSALALSHVLSLCVAQDLRVRVAAWFRGARPGRAAIWPLSSWEPVVFAGGRREVSCSPGEDSLIRYARPRLTDPNRVIGAKPAAFCYWMFGLLGALPGDELDDLFPGSGGVARAWEVYTSRAAAADALALEPRQVSCGAGEPRQVQAWRSRG